MRRQILITTSICLMGLFNYSFAQTDLNEPLKGICIYIDFPDAPINITTSRLDSLINGVNYQEVDVNRTFRSYWKQESRRNLDITHDIFYYTAPQPTSHYANLSWQNGILLWQDALESIIINNPNYDWSNLSKWTTSDPYNKDNPSGHIGGIKSVMIIGSTDISGGGWGGSHQPFWTLSNGEVITTISGSALQYPSDPNLNLFTIIHESGHAIFNLRDTYDFDGSSAGTSKYSLMSSSGPDVAPVGAPFLYQKEWGYVKYPEIGSNTFTLEADKDTIVVYKNIHDPNEFIAIEARKNSTLGNSLFPSTAGLLVWHSDLKNHNSNTLENRTRYEHYTHSIIQPDGLFELENGGSNPPINSGDIFVDGNHYNAQTLPSAHWWSSEEAGISIENIFVQNNSTITFDVIIEDQSDSLYDFLPKTGWSIVSETPALNGYEAINILDTDSTTYYHVPFNNTEPRPHEIIVDMGDDYFVNAFYYQANNNFSWPWEGRIENFELSTSTDGMNWSTIVNEKFFNSLYRQYMLFDGVVSRYFKFEAYSSHVSAERTSIASLDFRGVLATNLGVESINNYRSRVLNLYPNPATNKIFFSGLLPLDRVCIYDLTGRIIEQKTILDPEEFISIDSYSRGVYMCLVYGSRGELIEGIRFIKK